MEYLLITVGSMLFAVFLSYRYIKNIVGHTIKLKSLLLCAICAIVISLVIPRMVVGFAGLIGTLAILAVISVILAYFVSCYDKSEYKEAEITMSELETEGTSDYDTTVERLAVEDIAATISPQNCVAAEEVPEHLITDEKCDGQVIAPVFQVQIEQLVDSAENSNFRESTDEVCLEMPVSDSQTIQMEHKVIETGNQSPDVAADEVSDDTTDIYADGDIVYEEDEQLTETAINSSMSSDDFAPTNAQVYDTFDGSLEELMDAAFRAKEINDLPKALFLFSKSLSLYPNCDAAPFLVIEIGTLQKNAGLFDDAIATFSEGRRIAVSLNEDMLEKEFVEAVAYLRIVKNVLAENKFYNVPFQDIPSEVVESINKEFAEWRSLVNIV